jgi:DNA-directed RNA polymerase specialized sigma24 family protein
VSTGIPESYPSTATASALLGRPAIRRYLEGYVRRRVRPDDADDTVQAVLCAALEARRIPCEEEELRRWITGIARRKIADVWARARREQVGDTSEAECGSPPIEERALARWAEREASAHGGAAAASTLGWMAREGEGEKLESIAADVNEPPARVRQRVSRLRRWLRARWSAEIAAAVGVVVAIVLVGWFVLGRRRAPAPRGVPGPIVLPDLDPIARARGLRSRALRECDALDYAGCARDLDDAARLDPAGDAAPSVVEARARAQRAAAPPPPAPSSRSVAPSPPPPHSTSAPPVPAPTSTTSTPVRPTTPGKAVRSTPSGGSL